MAIPARAEPAGDVKVLDRGATKWSGTPRFYFWFIAIFSALLIFAPLRTGDLVGYDDAHYALSAKYIVATGDWLNLRSNGWLVREHPPLFVWMQAAVFKLFGLSDTLARLPSAVCGWGAILLVYWLARRILDERLAVLSMFVMATSIYFLKYAARGMTDVPFTFLCLCALVGWLLSEEDPRWVLVAGLFAGLAQITRGLIGIALPLAFLIDAAVNRKRPPVRLAIGALALTFLPLAAWYAHMFYVDGATFLPLHMAWLDQEVYGQLTPSWRRYTGAFEYLWMILKSYWPWLPFMATGLWVAARSGERRLRFLVIWIVVVFALCAAAKSRVLRYMLPVYPAFAILAAIGLQKLVPTRFLWKTLRVLTPMLAAGVVFIAMFPRRNFQATEIRAMAVQATAAAPAPERILFYDEAQPRFDETNQLQWYGNLYLDVLLTPGQLEAKLQEPAPGVYIVDRNAYREFVVSRPNHRVVGETDRLICFRLLRP